MRRQLFEIKWKQKKFHLMCNTERTELSEAKFVAHTKTHIFEPYGQTFQIKTRQRRKYFNISREASPS
jgi:hypothetical protein